MSQGYHQPNINLASGDGNVFHQGGDGTPAFAALRFIPFSGTVLVNAVPAPFHELLLQDSGALLNGFLLSGLAAPNGATLQLFADGVAVGTPVTMAVAAGLNVSTFFTFPDANFAGGARVALAITPAANWDRDFAFIGNWRIGT